MGSLSDETAPVIATIKYQLDDGVRYSSENAWNRGYLSAPQITQVPVTYPLYDLRRVAFGDSIKHEEIPDAGWSWSHSAEILKKFGFTAVKFDPKWVKADQDVQSGDYDDLETLEHTYFPEVTEAIGKLTGAKHVFITNSIIRRGDAPVKKATSIAEAPSTQTTRDGRIQVPDNYKAHDNTRPTHLASSDNSRPARGAHVDYTSLGARRSIRRWRPDIFAAAWSAGIIPTEDAICASIQVDAQDKESNAIIEKKYNADGNMGPRYAAYSVWRPMRTVTRDPLAMAARSAFLDNEALGFLGYESRMLAAPAMGEDFLRELEAVSITKEVAKAYEKENSSSFSSSSHGVDAATTNSSSGLRHLHRPQWYYLPEQKSDEVIVLKFFDSAALGGIDGVSGEAGGAPHASPDLGDAAHGEARWSIEVRCIAIW